MYLQVPSSPPSAVNGFQEVCGTTSVLKVWSGLVFCLFWKRPRLEQVLTFQKSEKTGLRLPETVQCSVLRSFAVVQPVSAGLFPKREL